MNQIMKQETLPAQADAMTLVAAAVQNGANMEQIDKLIDLVKFNDSREALKAFNSAFTKAQAKFPSVHKSKKAHNSMYAPYPEIVKAITPVLIAHGLSFRHEIKETAAGKTVTCILAHKAGHSESASLTAPPDTSGSKNPIQAIGSSVSYLKRYTLEAVTGVVTSDEDDDAQSFGLEVINQAQVIQIKDLIKDIHNKEVKQGKPKDKTLVEIAVMKRYEISAFENMTIQNFDRAMISLKARRCT